MAKTATLAEEQTEVTDLAVMENVDALAVFTDREQFSQFYRKMKEETDKHVPDISTERGRAAVRKLAFRVTKAKTKLDKAGLGLTEEWRQKTALVNASRREMVTQLDELAAEVRRPLTEWEEAERQRVETCQGTIQRFRDAAVVMLEDTSETVRTRGAELWEIEIGDEFGELKQEAEDAKSAAIATLGRALERLTKEEADRAELEKLRADAAEREAREAAEREQREREERERLEAEAAEHRRQEAEAAEAERVRRAQDEAAEIARQEALQRAREAEEKREREHQAELEEANRARAAAEEEARIERERREQEERERQEETRRVEAEEARIAEENRKREANRAHRTRVQSGAKIAIMTCGVDEATAQKIVRAIVAGEIPAVSLAF